MKVDAPLVAEDLFEAGEILMIEMITVVLNLPGLTTQTTTTSLRKLRAISSRTLWLTLSLAKSLCPTSVGKAPNIKKATL